MFPYVHPLIDAICIQSSIHFALHQWNIAHNISRVCPHKFSVYDFVHWKTVVGIWNINYNIVWLRAISTTFHLIQFIATRQYFAYRYNSHTCFHIKPLWNYIPTRQQPHTFEWLRVAPFFYLLSVTIVFSEAVTHMQFHWKNFCKSKLSEVISHMWYGKCFIPIWFIFYQCSCFQLDISCIIVIEVLSISLDKIPHGSLLINSL